MSTKRKTEYLTKRIVKRQAKKAVYRASVNAMEVAGFVIRVEDGWVVKEYKDGTIEQIKKLNESPNQEVVLD